MLTRYDNWRSRGRLRKASPPWWFFTRFYWRAFRLGMGEYSKGLQDGLDRTLLRQTVLADFARRVQDGIERE